MSKYTRGLLAVILAVVLVLPAAAFAMLPEANARSSTGMDGPTMTGKVVDPDTSNYWKFWAGGYNGKEVTTQNVGRIWTDKTVKAVESGDSDFLTTLSAISSTSDTTISGKPLDIVMVLDASGSMDDPMGTGDNTKRIDALKTAANTFIDAIAAQNQSITDASKQHRVTIVKFAGKKKTDKVGNDTYRDGRYTYNYSQTMKNLTSCKGKDADSLKDTVGNIKPAGSTQADYGLELAENITINSGRADAKKIVVFFTDGSPTSSSGFQASVADSAIASAKSLKANGADIYTIGIFNGANPSADPTAEGTSKVNKFMHAVSSNYPGATSSISFWGEWVIDYGTRAENSDYYKSATSASELEKIFEEISGSIIQTGYPTEVHSGYGEHKSGYITFTDELGDFMQVDNFTSVVYGGETFEKPSKKPEGNVDTYTFSGAAANLVITVQHAEEGKPQTGDIVTVKIPASLIPLRHFKITDGVLTVDNTEPIQVNYTSSVKKEALDNLFTPKNVKGLEDYIKSNTTTGENGSKTVNFYANKWNAGALGDTIANFEPADTNRYYYFQKQTPIYTDKDCTQPAKNPLADTGTYYYKDEFEEQGENGVAKPATAVIEFIGRDAAKLDGAIVRDKDGNLSFSAGTARLAFIDELHTDKNPNATGTASDVLNPRWNDTSSKASATHIDSHLGNNGKISFAYNMTPATVDTKAEFGLTKVLEGREWTGTDAFEFELSATSDNNAPMPDPATVTVTNADLDKDKAAINFDKITYAEPGKYTYEVREKNAGQTIDGIAYSKNVAEITVTVIPNKKGELSADVEVTSGKAKFENTYTANPAESSVTDKIDVTKSLTGRDLAAGEFSFELREVKGEDSELIETVKNAADGNVTFSPIKYTEIGQHTYTLHEVKGNAGGIAYDNTVYTIVTTIADNDKGQLVATHELKSAEGVKNIKFENAYNLTPKSFSVTDKIAATKFLTGRDLKAGEFSFELVEGNDVVATGTNAADGKIAMTAIEYTEAGEHTYTLREVNGGTASNGISYDGKTYTIVTTITDNGDGTLKAEHVLKDAKVAEFKNAYNLTPTDSSVTDEIKANKVLTGRDLKEGEFSFELVEGDEVVATGTNGADGTITMGAVKYDKPGKHTYTLREANGGTIGKGITYDGTTYTVETTITDNGDGALKAEHVLKDATSATFKNAYSVTPLDAELDFGLSKAVDGRDWTDADEFSFTITAPEGAPLPDPATVTVNKKDAKDGIAAIKFGKIHYAAAGTYKYEIRENAGNAAGMTYDGHVATAEVTVTENGEGVLTANVTKKENGHFTNTYRTELDYAAAGGLKLSKTLSGRPMTEGQFSFTVTPADEASANALGLLPGANTFKSPATAEATVGLIGILAGHEVKFTQADAGKTFKYTVAEKNDGKPGYTYDNAERTVKIAIADDGAGTLTATTTVSGGPEGTHETIHKSGENKVESALVPFENSYSASTDNPGVSAQIVATKTLTGRPLADGEFYFGIAYAGETEAISGTPAFNYNGQVSFGTLHYDTKMLADLVSTGRAIRTDTDGKLAWTINYTAFEYTNLLADQGITAAKSSFSFKVIVVDNGDGTLTAKPDYGGVEPVFENVYGADAVDAALAGTKKLQAAEGLTPADIAGKFTFTVTADEAGAPMPERATATNDAAGNVDFGKIHFTLEDLNRALGVTTDASDDASSDAEANADEAEVDADAAETDGSNDESEPAAPTAPRSHTFTYTVAESGTAPGVTNDANTARKVSYTVTDDGAGHLSVVRNGDDGAAFTFTNTYSVTPTNSVVTDQVKTVKRLIGRDLAAGEFTFELLEDGVTVASGTNDANGNVTLSPIRYEAPGTHTYTLREACPNALGLYKGVTYDGTTYTVVTTVSDNGDGTLAATHKLEGTTESAGFTNKYHAMSTQVSIGAIKVLEGRELKKDEFSFKLVGEDAESTVTNDADGKINFDKFEYDEPGSYVYTISEVKGDEAGMTYDKSVFTVTVNVVDDGEGNLKANVAFTKGDKSVEGIVFNNTYKKPETPVPAPDPGPSKTVTNIVKTVKGFLPTTGDQQAAALLMAFVIAMAGVGALVWGIRKR
ncbi:Spy0128 family protein [Collinsella aerofaciens]|uniref:Spy0128 family protein n=1 Tax=Collinsella aerofaciens TaxID=74426 RepID=UPI0018AC7A48|nr:FctA domain-containing protein [Collinsella aerofaciens]MDB1827920.1 VWA domain-containing protein [Collinsella aerofaciens]MDB1833581.1 VWA domain-containing protein [Collinsella aerofaciens]